ncbi:MAG: hypothetical protein ACI9S8_001099 [Chlamydiales bacterium]
MVKNYAFAKKEQHYRYTLTSFVNSLESSKSDLSVKEGERQRSADDLETILKKVMTSLLNPEGGLPSEQYKKFHSYLRQALNCEEYRQALALKHIDASLSANIDLLHHLCLYFFTGINIHEFCAQLVKDMQEGNLLENAVPLQNPADLERDLKQSFTDVKRIVDSQKTYDPSYWWYYVKDQINLGFDPFAQGNLPNVLFKTRYRLENGKEKDVLNIRCGTPTYEDLFSIVCGEAEVNPEFRGYLEACRRFGKKHLYVNLQNRNPRFLWKNEAPRCKAIENLQGDFQDVLTVIGLSKDSPFYMQNDGYIEQNEVDKFKSEFFKQMFEVKVSWFYFPDSLLNDGEIDFREEVANLIEDVHSTLFEGNEMLDRQERLDFIEIVYVLIIELIIFKSGSDFYNTSCKDCIDRAGGMNSLLALSQNLRQMEGDGGIDYKDLAAITFAPAVLVRQREIKFDRLERLISSAKKMIETKESSLFRESKWTNGWKVKNVFVY